MMPPRRKKWTEAEEKTLIDKYGDLVSNGTLAKMKTREKKFKPIACYVNTIHHLRDPGAYPWNWTWKDVSTKVQNMRHQYLLVKQKIKRPPTDSGADDVEEFDWMEGLTYWSNFLRYKEVFGDVGIVYGSNEGHELMVEGSKNDRFLIETGREMEIGECCPQIGNATDGDDFGADIEGGVELGFEYDGRGDVEKNYNGSDNGFVIEDADQNRSCSSKKRSKSLKKLEKRAWGFITKQLWQLRDMESRFERNQEDLERNMQRRENHWVELKKEWDQKLEESERHREERAEMREELRKKRIQEWEDMERDNAERERRRREEELREEREWEERMNRRRSEWKKRMDERLNQHRAEMNQLQSRIVHDQQNLTSQLIGLVSHWAGHGTGFSDHSVGGNPYLSQVMQNLHHVNGIVHGDAGVDDGNQDDQFIVDG